MSKAFRDYLEANPGASKREVIDALAPVYENPGRTKQSFKDSCDINSILKRAQVTGSLSHWQAAGAFYADLADMPTDPFEVRALMDRANETFLRAPAEVRKEFGHDVLAFAKFVNDPGNKDRVEELLPAIAEPGRYFLDASSRTPPGAARGAASAPQGASTATPDSGGATTGEVPSGGDTGGASSP